MGKTQIITALTQDYFNKSADLFRSLIVNAAGFDLKLLCIGFQPPADWFGRDKIQTATCKIEDISTYRKGWPANRKQWVCPEGGEFLNYFDVPDEDMIIHLDSDMIMQRPITEKETELINSIGDGVGMCSHNYPIITLKDESKCIARNKKYKQLFDGDWDNEPRMCTALIAAKAKTFRRLSSHYTGYYDKLTQAFNHHAAGQWLISYIIYRHQFNLIDLGGVFHNASWYSGGGTVENEVLEFKGEKVLFNHTKYAYTPDYDTNRHT